MRSTSLYNQIIPYRNVKVKKRLANMTSLLGKFNKGKIINENYLLIL